MYILFNRYQMYFFFQGIEKEEYYNYLDTSF